MAQNFSTGEHLDREAALLATAPAPQHECPTWCQVELALASPAPT